MATVYSKALDKSMDVDRLIGSVNGKQSGPTLIFTGGIHGNEPSGVFALDQLMKQLAGLQDNLKGSAYAISGNLWALERQERFEKEDLNRLWNKERMQKVLNGRASELEHNEDTLQQLEIHQLILDILDKEEGPFFFIDLHTTSGETMPFLTVNDTLLNRKFSLQFPVPIILGIEEFLDGPLLSFINYLGYIAVGFESGQHDDISSVQNHLSFALVSLVMAGCLKSNELPDFQKHYDNLGAATKGQQNIFEIKYRHEIQSDEKFKMKPGFTNFQQLEKGTVLATSNGKEISTTKKEQLFMPLYQSQGDDGYFLVRKTPYFFLKFSTLLRKIRFDKFIALFPGINWKSKTQSTLVIKLNVARFFAKEFFHLLGYRSRLIDETHMYAKNRESKSLTADYKNVKWYKNGK